MNKSFQDIFSSFTSLMELLRNKDFQHLLENYQRAKKSFLIGYDIIDEVVSEDIFSFRDKTNLKPQDYLEAFSEFIKTKNNEIEAISILLSKPQHWNPDALKELKNKLKENDFPEDEIRRAHKSVYHKDLIDIISMVKHAVKAEEPLLQAKERVENAFQKIRKKYEFSYEQINWIDYIKQHMISNLSIDKSDFEAIPIFESHGGWRKFQKVFKNIYKDLLIEINEAIAA